MNWNCPYCEYGGEMGDKFLPYKGECPNCPPGAMNRQAGIDYEKGHKENVELRKWYEGKNGKNKVKKKKPIIPDDSYLEFLEEALDQIDDIRGSGQNLSPSTICRLKIHKQLLELMLDNLEDEER